MPMLYLFSFLFICHSVKKKIYIYLEHLSKYMKIR